MAACRFYSICKDSTKAWCFFAALAVGIPSASAVEQVDQQQGDGINAVVANLPIGQTFTPTHNNLSSFSFFFRPILATFDFRIIHWSDQVQLAQVTFDKTNPAQGFYDVPLPTPISLTPGDKYGIIETNVSQPFFMHFLFDNNIDIYTGGHPVTGGAEQTETTGVVSDLAFQTFYETTFVPEPSSLALLGLGAVGLLALRRRRT